MERVRKAGDLVLAGGKLIEDLQVTPFDLAEPHVTFLMRRLARVEMIARAYGVNFFGRSPDYSNTERTRYDPYMFEPPDSCCIAVTLGGSTFLTSQHFESLHPYSQAVIRALSGCDVSKPMFGPFEPTRNLGGLNFVATPDGQYIQQTLEMYHEALYHLALLLEYPRVLGDKHKAGSPRAPYGFYLEKQQLFDVLGKPVVDTQRRGQNPLKERERLFPRLAATLLQYIHSLGLDITERDDYVALSMYPWWPASSQGGRRTDQSVRVPDRCVHVWVGSASSSEGLALEQSYGIDSVSDIGRLRAYIASGMTAPPHERGALQQQQPPPRQQSLGGPQQPAVSWSRMLAGGYDATKDPAMQYAYRVLSPPSWASGKGEASAATTPFAHLPLGKIKYIRALVVRHDLVFELTTYIKQMDEAYWQLLRRFSELGPADLDIADAEGLFSKFMIWRRDHFTTSSIPFNAPPQNTAYFVFCF